jgi:ornithine decarboxylase
LVLAVTLREVHWRTGERFLAEGVNMGAISSSGPEQFASVGAMLCSGQPREPVYCIYPRAYQAAAREFLSGFPGRVLYAVKANDDPSVIKILNRSGVRHFDCASLAEIRLVRELCPDAGCYFMVPVTVRGAIAEAFRDHGVRHFMVDHPAGLDILEKEVSMPDCVVFARMAVSHDAAKMDLSSKFGARPAEMPALLSRIRTSGAEPAFAFNVGSMVTSPEAYRYAMRVAREVLEPLEFRVRLIDIGGGFPSSYPGFIVPPLDEFFRVVSEARGRLPMQKDGELMAEPGRALAAPGLSAVVEILLRKEQRIYINDGMFGAFWELRFKAHRQYPVRVFRNGQIHTGKECSFTVYGPTCDASDVLPDPLELPDDIRPGDYLEFGNIGAYSVSGRTRFNGHYSERIVEITSEEEQPPGNRGV